MKTNNKHCQLRLSLRFMEITECHSPQAPPTVRYLPHNNLTFRFLSVLCANIFLRALNNSHNDGCIHSLCAYYLSGTAGSNSAANWPEALITQKRM